MIGASKLIVKSLSGHFVEARPGLLTGIFPRTWEAGAEGCAPQAGPPVVVQEYVEHECELRVYYIDGQVRAFRIGKSSPVSPWLAPDAVTTAEVDPPREVVAATTRLADALRLRYGAFDFLLREGSPVFLEVNPCGDWLWAEIRSGSSQVTHAVAGMLCRLHRQVLGSGSVGRAVAPLDLLAFLVGQPGPPGQLTGTR